ncbi:MAG: hypothetical protein Q7R62_03130 [bacterium]|nr:hypothetical protein [bacterium]
MRNTESWGIETFPRSVADGSQPDNAKVAAAQMLVGHPGHIGQRLNIRSEGETRMASGSEVPLRTKEACDALRVLWQDNPQKAEQIEESWFEHDIKRPRMAELARRRFAGYAHFQTGGVGVEIGL